MLKYPWYIYVLHEQKEWNRGEWVGSPEGWTQHGCVWAQLEKGLGWHWMDLLCNIEESSSLLGPTVLFCRCILVVMGWQPWLLKVWLHLANPALWKSWSWVCTLNSKYTVKQRLAISPTQWLQKDCSEFTQMRPVACKTTWEEAAADHLTVVMDYNKPTITVTSYEVFITTAFQSWGI